MHPHTHTFLSALQAALCSRAVYGEDHSSFVQQSAGAARACAEMIASQGPVTVIFLDGRVIVNDRAAQGRAGEFGPLAARVAVHGMDALRVVGALSAQDVTSVVGFLSSAAGSEMPLWAGVSLARSHTLAGGGGTSDGGSGVASTSGLPDARTFVNQVETLWGAQTRAGDTSGADSEQMSQLIASISASVAASRMSVLRLAAVKDMDEYTFVHTVNVSIQSAALAEAVGLSREHVYGVIEAGLLHDVGKASVPPHILGKKGMLNDAERDVIQQHPVDGAAMLLERNHPNHLAVIVALEHHMHIDGTGYPAPRRGRKPHLASQIVQVADVFDALRTHRPYRAALPHDVAMETMWKSAGTKFDRDLLSTFFERVAKHAPVPEAA